MIKLFWRYNMPIWSKKNELSARAGQILFQRSTLSRASPFQLRDLQ